MASFVEDLWNSIFTPGPTPTLLVATNVSFAALQLVLFALLLATYSVHFVVLSFLCGSLWWAINWFAREVRAAQAAEAAKEQKSEKRPAGRSAESSSSKPPGAIDTTESETETESLSRSKVSLSASGTSAGAAARSTAASSVNLRPPTETEDVRRRPSSSLAAGDTSSGYGSTDSEWEKVDDTKGL